MKPSKLAGCNVRKNPDPPKPERNKPCPCVSGKKFKHCCGNARMLSEKRKEDDAKFFAALKKKEEERRIAAEQASKNTQSEILYERRPLRRMSPPLMFAALAIGLGSLGGNFGAPRNVITPKKR